MQYAIPVLVGAVMIDVLGFLMWTLSGQTPVDGFYIGALTETVINLAR